MLDAFSEAAHSNADDHGTAPVMPTLGAFSSTLGKRFFGATPGDFRNSEFKAGLDDEDRPWLRTRSLLVEELNAGTVLMQGNMTHGWDGQQDATNGGVGLGLRRTFGGDEWLAGANVFVDDGWSDETARGSFGGQLQTAPFGVRVNFYQPYASNALGDSPLAGHDLTFRFKIPYVPSVTASVDSAAWWRGVTEGSPVTNRFAVNFKPLPYLNFDGGMTQPAGGEPSSFSMGMRLVLALGGRQAPSLPLIDDRPFRFSSISDRAFDSIKRNESIPPWQ